MLHIYIDGDACPVKEETYKVAQRYGLDVTLVANAFMRVPAGDWFKLVVVENGPDAADDWIAEHAGKDDIVITGDFPLAARCLDNEARVLGHKGRSFTEDNMADALASRHLLTMLRDQGEMTKGPPPFTPKDRSKFLQRLDQTINEIKRDNA
jgi:uncharacterized protein YaiI (UPF0178 family)